MHHSYHARLLAALALCACAPDEPEPEPVRPAADRPDIVQDTILLEGMPEPTTARLLVLADFATPFSTYVPDGIASRIEQTGDTGAVRFSAAFTGRDDPNAYMHVRLYPTGTDLLAAREEVAAFLRSRRPQDDPTGASDVLEPHEPVPPPDWAVEAHAFAYEGDGAVPYTGRILLGQYGERYFHVLTHYPAEYGDGLAPRFQFLLEHWRWEQTGEMLVR